MPNRRDEPLDQPGFDRPLVGIAVGIEPRQVGFVLRQLLSEIVTNTEKAVNLAKSMGIEAGASEAPQTEETK